MITGETFKEWGFKPGAWFKDALVTANDMARAGATEMDVYEHVRSLAPPEIQVQEFRTNSLPFAEFLDAETPDELENLRGVRSAMDQLMRVPTVRAGVVMPDAMPAGIIPVGGVVATENAIHPGFHSADICCSVAMTVFKRDEDVKKVLDAAEKVTHFGPLKIAASAYRANINRFQTLKSLLDNHFDNPFLKGLEEIAAAHFLTQGDGNHFLYVGHLESTGQLAVVTHHGSRGLGAHLYKRGMQAAERHTGIVSPRTPKQASWIQADSAYGEAYWEALQVVREWTKLNHFTIHNELAKKLGNKIVDHTWNEHNFVFRKSDGLFYHGKGATPNWAGFADDDDGTTLIPLNMSEPILISQHVDNKDSLGFAPHGAGRNMSRTRFLNENRPKVPTDIDVRFYCGVPDLSELPEAYKNADSVRSQIDKYKLANIVDTVIPGGSMMAGDWEKDAPWRKKRR